MKLLSSYERVLSYLFTKIRYFTIYAPQKQSLLNKSLPKVPYNNKEKSKKKETNVTYEIVIFNKISVQTNYNKKKVYTVEPLYSGHPL